MRSKLHIIVIGLFITIAGAYSQISLNKVLKNEGKEISHWEEIKKKMQYDNLQRCRTRLEEGTASQTTKKSSAIIPLLLMQ